MNNFSGHCKGRTIKSCRKTKHCTVYKRNGKSKCRKLQLYGSCRRKNGGKRRSKRRSSRSRR